MAKKSRGQGQTWRLLRVPLGTSWLLQILFWWFTMVEKTDQQKQPHNMHHPKKKSDFEHPSKLNIWKYNCLFHHFATCRIAPFNLLINHVVTFEQKTKYKQSPCGSPICNSTLHFFSSQKKSCDDEVQDPPRLMEVLTRVPMSCKTTRSMWAKETKTWYSIVLIGSWGSLHWWCWL